MNFSSDFDISRFLNQEEVLIVMKILLFLGSGVSFDSGMPNTETITQIILDDDWFIHTDQNFYHGKEPNPYNIPRNYAPRVQAFLKIIKEISDEYFQERRERESNYEDLFYLSQQLVDEVEGEIDNPAIPPFVHHVNTKVQHLYEAIPMREQIDLGFLASKACDLINCAVWYALSNDAKPKGLDLAKELSNHKDIMQLDIATLNHDLLLEQLFSENKINYNDGFGEQDGEVRYFDPQTLDNVENKISLFKLHGSINWYVYREKSDGKVWDRYAITNGDFYHARNSKNEMLQFISFRPRFLTGSYNKMLDYGFGIIAELHRRFNTKLLEHDIMIMSGYGWNDRGINGKIFDWLLSSYDKKLILLHQNPEEDIKKKSKSAMWHRYDPLVKEGRLIPVKKWLSEVSIDEILKIIEKD